MIKNLWHKSIFFILIILICKCSYSEEEMSENKDLTNLDKLEVYVSLLNQKMEIEGKLAIQKMKYENDTAILKEKIESLEKEFIYKNLPPEAERTCKVWLKSFRASTGFYLDKESSLQSVKLIWDEWMNLSKKPPFYLYFLNRMFETRAKVGQFETLYNMFLNIYEDPLVRDKDLEWRDETQEDKKTEEKSEQTPDYKKNR